ncbi:AGAP006388-PA-like protein [Anopheles sinensis]|uniref:AGAP006388-PA-like protein n=1 Tax=Anopheles sinensis TaxID=74873 RepID=A0A084WV20_ANOSI|nr:AGAP006388-PA-like protein [Anopheles sinensis]
MKKCATKENFLHQKIEECTETIAGLGALPNVDASYQKTSLKAKERNQYLKKYNNVNKKAFDQFLSSSKQEKLYARKAELDVAKDNIYELMQLLEVRKVEAIQVTFRQVAAIFTEVFKKLVPEGNGHLILRTASRSAASFPAIPMLWPTESFCVSSAVRAQELW